MKYLIRCQMADLMMLYYNTHWAYNNASNADCLSAAVAVTSHGRWRDAAVRA